MKSFKRLHQVSRPLSNFGGLFGTLNISTKPLKNDNQRVEEKIAHQKFSNPPSLSHATSSARLSSKIIQIDDILPHDKVLAQFYANKEITIDPMTQKQIITLILNFINMIFSQEHYRTDFLTSHLSSESFQMLETSLLSFPCTQKDLIQLTKIVLKAEAGLPIAYVLSLISVKSGNPHAKFIYSQLLSRGCLGIEPNPVAGKALLIELADSGFPDAQNLHGTNLIQESQLTTTANSQLQTLENNPSLSTGVKYLIKAAQNNNPHANAQLGFMLSKGIGFEKDDKKAVEYLTKADTLGVIEATFLLGMHHMTGRGLQVDKQKGFEYYLKAANQGLAIAQHNVGSIYFEGDSESVDESKHIKQQIWKAIEYWKMASMNGMQLSMINLGKLYTNGYGLSNQSEKPKLPIEVVPVDYSQAREYLEMALRAGGALVEEAQDSLARLDTLEKAKTERKTCIIM